ncbi:MAG: hypothetical protein H0W72_16465 [Planctomycetes bacterium]|nr:hypothetical protein [Planctomycetota bacterium]
MNEPEQPEQAGQPAPIDLVSATATNLAAMERVLDALVSLKGEFPAGGNSSERWFFTATCTVVFANYRLQQHLGALAAAQGPWPTRLAGRALGAAMIDTVDTVSDLTTRTFERHLAAITNNPAITDPIDALFKRFAAFRRVNDTRLRVARKALGLDEDAKQRELLAFDADLDLGGHSQLAMETIVWLTDFGKAATLLIGVIRSERARGGPQQN